MSNRYLCAGCSTPLVQINDNLWECPKYKTLYSKMKGDYWPRDHDGNVAKPESLIDSEMLHGSLDSSGAMLGMIALVALCMFIWLLGS